MGPGNAEAGIVWKKTQEKGALGWSNETISPLWSLLRSLDGNLGQLDPSIECKNRKTGQQSHRPDHIDALGQRKRIMNRRGARGKELN